MKKKIIMLLIAALTLTAAFANPISTDYPSWVTNGKTSKNSYYAVGKGKMSSPKTSALYAQSEATSKLAETAQLNKCTKKLTLWQKLFGVKTERIVVQTELKGVKLEEQWIDSDGTVYVLMSCPKQQ